GNIMITPDGRVKVLDFGLAKSGAEQQPEDLSNSPTLVSAASRTGVILGTAAYMSPDQARGKAIDKRSDIWAFGWVLYEMLSGTQAFGGDSVSDIIANTLDHDPDWSKLPSNTPSLVRTLLRQCLTKSAADRLHDVADARIHINESQASTVSGETFVA